MPRPILTWMLCIAALPGGLCAKAQGQDAAAMEEQYKTCTKHYIPADKCTPEIYKQLKDRDNAPLEPKVASALSAVKEYQGKLKNPASMQVHTAYVTDKGDVCLAIGGQNGLGGQTVDRIVFTNKGKWLTSDSLASSRPGGGADRWFVHCTSGLRRTMVPGTDVTEKVNQALKEAK